MKPIVTLRWMDATQAHQIDRTEAARMIRHLRSRRHSPRLAERTETTYDRNRHATRAAVPWSNVTAYFCRL